MNISPEKITAPVAFAIVGFAMMVIGGTGLVPFANIPVSEYRAFFFVGGISLIVVAIILFLREQEINKPRDYASQPSLSVIRSPKDKHNLRITFPPRDNLYRAGPYDFEIDVSGEINGSPRQDAALKLFVRTDYGYWRQDYPVKIVGDKWYSKVDLWKAKADPGYDAFLAIALLDKCGLVLVEYSRRAHVDGKANTPFTQLPSNIEKSDEVRVRRE